MDYSEDRIVRIAPYQDGVERFELRNDKFLVQKHSTLRDYHRELGAALLAGLYKFCCVRNPWDRAISHYFSPHRGVTAWDRMKFLATLPAIRPAEEFLQIGNASPSQSFSDNVDFVMRFENLAEDFQTVCRHIGLPQQELPVRNRSVRNHYASYYDDELVEAVKNRFATEIRYFGYSFSAKDD